VIRPDEGRWGAGVAAGIARRWDIDVVLVRGLFVAFTIVGGLGVAVYGIGWLLLPQEDGRIHLQQAIRGDFTVGFVGAVILSLAVIGGGGGGGLWHDGFWFNGGFPGGLLLTVAVIAGIWWLARGHGQTDSSTPPAPASPLSAAGYSTPPGYGNTPSGYGTTSSGYRTPPGYGTPPPYGTPGLSGPASSGPSGWSSPGAVNSARSAKDRAREMSAPSKTIVRFTLGVALLVAAAILVIGHLSDWSAPVGVIAAATALAVLAVGVIVSGLNGRRAAGLVGIGILLALGTLAGSGADSAGIRSGQNVVVVGTQDWRPSTADRAGTQFNLGVGEATVWLTNPAILSQASAANPLRISARVGAGHLTVVVPDAVPVRIEVQMGAGEVVNPDGSTKQVNGNRGNGNQVENLTTGPAGRPLMIVQVQQGVGQLELKTANQAASITVTPSATTTVTAAPTPTASATK
jgi:phage shock protein PspC (stress-responsive transcriptional regulator)